MANKNRRVANKPENKVIETEFIENTIEEVEAENFEEPKKEKLLTRVGKSLTELGEMTKEEKKEARKKAAKKVLGAGALAAGGAIAFVLGENHGYKKAKDEFDCDEEDYDEADYEEDYDETDE